MPNGTLKSREQLNNIIHSFLQAEYEPGVFSDLKIFFSKIATNAIGTNPLGGNTFQKTIIYFSIFITICDVRINVNIHPFTLYVGPPLRANTTSQSFNILYGVNN